MSLIATISPWFVRLNIAEACVWFAIALGLLIFSKRRSADLVLILALTAFGISDLVETKTGGWYKPWWMFLWKTLCVLTIAPITIRKLRATRKSG